MKPFNLKEALEGKPVITRDGKEVTQITHFKDVNDKYCIMAVIDNQIISFHVDGSYFKTCIYNKDLFMAPIKTKYYVYIVKSDLHSMGFISVGPTINTASSLGINDYLLRTLTFEIDE